MQSWGVLRTKTDGAAHMLWEQPTNVIPCAFELQHSPVKETNVLLSDGCFSLKIMCQRHKFHFIFLSLSPVKTSYAARRQRKQCPKMQIALVSPL
jgi:hypothetical protein